MKQRDIEGALNLLISLSDKEATARQLQALRVAKVEADEAKAQAERAQQDATDSHNTADIRHSELAKREQQLHQREARLQEAEQQHQFTMDGEIKGLNAQKEALAEQATEFAKLNKIASDEWKRRTSELDKREKALAKRELDAQKRDEALTEREQAWKQGMHDLETTKAKLKELTA